MNRTNRPLFVALGALLALLLFAGLSLARGNQLMAQDTPDSPDKPQKVYIPVVQAGIEAEPTFEPEVPIVEPPEEGDPGSNNADTIFADGFETNYLWPWSARVLDGTDLSAVAAARIVGPIGMRATVNDKAVLYVIDHRPTAEPRLRTRFYFDPNSINMAPNDILTIYGAYSTGDRLLVRIELVQSNGYKLRASILNDSRRWIYLSDAAISDGAHLLEIDWVKSDSSTSVNGALTFWVDETIVGKVLTVNNDRTPIERSRLGVLTAPSGGTRGALYFDQFESRRTTYIGPAAPPVPPTPTAMPTGAPTAVPTVTPTPVAGNVPILFVSRQIPNAGSIYWSVPNDLPGVGPHSRFRVASPGKLQVREVNGTIRTLIDGANPTAASLNLIDVSAPDVSYDGTTIVFAGLPAGSYNRGPVTNPDAWRIYSVRTDGSGLRQITRSDQNLSMAQFGAAGGGLDTYDDTDPAWLPDGRIVFSSTRYPSYAQYSGVRTSNLFVVNADGGGMHRITSERNGADRPTIDPVTGKIVYARWWRNHRFAADSMATIPNGSGGYVQNLGLTSDRDNHVGGADFLWRNQWHPAAINPDGTSLEQWGGTHHRLDSSHSYGGSFLPNGDLLANYYPMHNMTEAGGFGGIRLFKRGPFPYQPVLGITYLTLDYVSDSNPTSYGIFVGNYATDAAALPNGKVVVSWARDVAQDYGLYTINQNGSGLTLLYDNPGTTELRAKPIMARPLPPIIADSVPAAASPLPPLEGGNYAQDGTFTFDALNIYANGPVDTEISTAIPVGSAQTLRFFTDFQRTSGGSFPNLDWPILLGEMTVAPDGSVRKSDVPANVPLFEQIRSADGTVPLSRGNTGSAAHVAGMNFGKPGEVQRCVGCHVGHTMIAVPANDADARFSNVAPGAAISVSSTRDANQNRGLVDRRVLTGEIWRYWNSASGQTTGQWVQLSFPVPVTVRTIRLYNPRSGGEANSSIQVGSTAVRLYSDAGATQQVAEKTTGALSVNGTSVAFADVRARSVRVYITATTGTFYGSQLAALAEVEVIARAEAP